jgi:hypothetical protein
MVRELLHSNKELREIADKSKKRQEQMEQELVILQRENQDLRDKIIMEQYNKPINESGLYQDDSNKNQKIASDQSQISLLE